MNKNSEIYKNYSIFSILTRSINSFISSTYSYGAYSEYISGSSKITICTPSALRGIISCYGFPPVMKRFGVVKPHGKEV